MTFDSNLFLAPGSAGNLAHAFVAGDYGPVPVLRNNVFWAGTVAARRNGIYANYAPPAMTLEHNDFVPMTGSLTCLLGGSSNGYCLTTAADLNALNGTGVIVSHNNVSIDAAFASPSTTAPTVAGYHLGPTCALRGLGVASAAVSRDFDGDPRDAGAPDIGPDECR